MVAGSLTLAGVTLLLLDWQGIADVWTYLILIMDSCLVLQAPRGTTRVAMALTLVYIALRFAEDATDGDLGLPQSPIHPGRGALLYGAVTTPARE
eukprot:gene30904-8054_t